MAKKPDPKKTSRPDKLPPPAPIEPEEAAFADLISEEDPLILDEEIVDLDAAAVVDEADEVIVVGSSDSAIDLGQEASKPISNEADSFDWNDLADNPAPSSIPSQPAQFDAPSDVDVIGNAPSSLIPRKQVVPEEEDALASPAHFDYGVESSRVDLSEPPPRFNPLESHIEKTVRPAEEILDLAETQPPGVPEVPVAPPVLDLGLDEPVEVEGGLELVDEAEDAIDLGSEIIIAGDSGVLIEDEVIDLESTGPTLMLHDGSLVSPEAENEVIDLATPAAKTGESSVIDLSGENIEIVDASTSAIGSGMLARVQGQESGINLEQLDVVEEAEEEAEGANFLLGEADAEEATALDLGVVAGVDDEVVVDQPIVLGDNSSAVNLGETMPGTDGQSGLGADLFAEEQEIEEETLVPSEDEAFDIFREPTGPVVVASDDEEVSIEDEEGPPSRGTGEVELGGPRPVLDDSNEGTLEDRLDEEVSVEDDELFASAAAEAEVEDEEPPTKKTKSKRTAATAEDEDEPRSSRATKPAKRSVVPLVLTGVASVLIGAAACFGGLFLANMVSFEEKKAVLPPPKETPKGSVARQVSIAKLVDDGDLTEDPPAIEDSNPQQLAARGQYRWLKYLQARLPEKDKKPSTDDQEVKDALADLKQAQEGGDIEAIYWIGHIHELTGNLAEARKVYADGKTKHEKHVKYGPLFEAALDRLDVMQPASKPGGAQTQRPIDSAELLLVLLLLQMDPVGEPKAELPEAGFDFWKALKLARDQKYNEAATALTTAKKNHETRRSTRIRKAQNPASDPTEEIFSRCCEELARLWLIQDRLRSVPNLAFDKADPVKGTDAVIAALAVARTDIMQLTKDKTALETDKTKLMTELTTAMTANTDLTKKLTDANEKIKVTEKDRDDKIKAKDAEIVLAKKETKDTTDKLMTATAQITALTTDKTTLLATQGQIVAKLEKAMVVMPKPDTKQLIEGIDKVIKLAEMKDPSSELRNCMMKGDALTKELEQRWKPSQMLDFWQPLMADRRQVALAPKALLDVERARKEDPKVKAQALYVEALTLRTQNKNVEARAKLDEAIKEAKTKEPWSAQAEQLLKEWSDPTVFYLPEVDKLHKQRNYLAALNTLNDAIELFPATKGKLLARRADVRLDMLLDQVRGKINATTPGFKEVESDADAAVTAGDAAVDAALVSGRRFEAVGQYDRAVEQYRKAVAAAKGVQLLEAKAGLVRSLYNSTTDTAVMEAYKLADEVLASPDIDKEPLLKAQMLVIKEKWTPALRTHAVGLQPYLTHGQGTLLLDLIRDNPTLAQPEQGGQPQDPFAGEKNYGLGLDLYFSRRYADAEKAFTRAIEADNQDARYFYFLGLSRLAQSNTGAALKAFNAGARLEVQNKPNSTSIANALERVQGSPRQMINAARERARE